MGQKERMLIEHPAVVHPFINGGGEAGYLRIFPEILAGGQCAGNQPGRIACGNLTVPVACARANVQEMIEPAMNVAHRACGIRAQDGPHAAACRMPRDPTPLGADAQRSQREPGSARAADVSPFRRMQAAVSAGAIARDPAMRIGLFPEVEETAAGKIVQQLVVRGGEVPACRATLGRQKCRSKTLRRHCYKRASTTRTKHHASRPACRQTSTNATVHHLDLRSSRPWPLGSHSATSRPSWWSVSRLATIRRWLSQLQIAFPE